MTVGPGTDDVERPSGLTAPSVVMGEADAPDPDPAAGAGPRAGPEPEPVPVTMSLRVVWRVGLMVLALVALASFIRFVVTDGGSVLFTVLMSWFAALAMTPLVNRLAMHMRRGAATGLVMVGFAVFAVVFFLAFGALFVQQLVQLIELLPTYVDRALAWVNDTFSTSLTTDSRPGVGEPEPRQAGRSRRRDRCQRAGSPRLGHRHRVQHVHLRDVHLLPVRRDASAGALGGGTVPRPEPDARGADLVPHPGEDRWLRRRARGARGHQLRRPPRSCS